jgi:starch synthase
MADPALLEKYGKAGRARAESEFGWDAVAAQTIALYKSVINN